MLGEGRLQLDDFANDTKNRWREEKYGKSKVLITKEAQ